MIKVGDTLPDARLFEFIEEATEGCAVGPNGFSACKRTAGKRVVIFGLPGAFTPMCSARHVPDMSTRRRICPPPASTKSGAFPSTTR